VLVVVIFLVVTVLTGSFRTVELIGVTLGAFQFIFIPLMFMVGPDWGEVGEGLVETKFGNHTWISLVTANIGAVIMPWMLYYQQS